MNVEQQVDIFFSFLLVYVLVYLSHNGLLHKRFCYNSWWEVTFTESCEQQLWSSLRVQGLSSGKSAVSNYSHPQMDYLYLYYGNKSSEIDIPLTYQVQTYLKNVCKFIEESKASYSIAHRMSCFENNFRKMLKTERKQSAFQKISRKCSGRVLT